MSIYRLKLATNLISSAICLYALASASSAQAKDKPSIELVSISKISTYQLWSVSVPQHADGGIVVATYWPFDAESGLYSGDRKICGLLLLGSPDIGSQPTGFEVRGQTCNLSLKGLKGGTPAFELQGENETPVSINVGGDGKIIRNGRPFGRVEI